MTFQPCNPSHPYGTSCPNCDEFSSTWKCRSCDALRAELAEVKAKLVEAENVICWGVECVHKARALDKSYSEHVELKKALEEQKRTAIAQEERAERAENTIAGAWGLVPRDLRMGVGGTLVESLATTLIRVEEKGRSDERIRADQIEKDALQAMGAFVKASDEKICQAEAKGRSDEHVRLEQMEKDYQETLGLLGRRVHGLVEALEAEKARADQAEELAAAACLANYNRGKLEGHAEGCESIALWLEENCNDAGRTAESVRYAIANLAKVPK